MNENPVILIVDDEPTARQTIEMLLLRQSYELIFATNGPEALASLEVMEPDVILLDVMMPGMDGLEVCQRLKSSQTWQHIPVILVTALDSKEDLARGLEAGADDFLHKPVSGIELRSRVRSMLRIKQRHDTLTTLMQLRQDLSHMIMHDIRSPLTTITLYSDLLEAYVSPQGKNALNTIISQVNRLNSFVTDMLMLAKMEHGSLVLLCQPADLGLILAKVRENYQIMAQMKGINLSFELPEALPHPSLDANLWQRVLDNLLSNALKFSRPNSTVTLQVSQPAADLLRWRVCDEGPGIPEEFHQTIFDKYQIAASNRTDVKQIGLGLAFCKLVVEAHNGRIYVESNQPNGAIFTIDLPLPAPKT
ncbi:MAG: response regulator [Ardenticatenaceae bacterium]|nr:response regulator [Ardenticatenaceae bacterium]